MAIHLMQDASAQIPCLGFAGSVGFRKHAAGGVDQGKRGVAPALVLPDTGHQIERRIEPRIAFQQTGTNERRLLALAAFEKPLGLDVAIRHNRGSIVSRFSHTLTRARSASPAPQRREPGDIKLTSLTTEQAVREKDEARVGEGAMNWQRLSDKHRNPDSGTADWPTRQ